MTLYIKEYQSTPKACLVHFQKIIIISWNKILYKNKRKIIYFILKYRMVTLVVSYTLIVAHFHCYSYTKIKFAELVAHKVKERLFMSQSMP